MKKKNHSETRNKSILFVCYFYPPTETVGVPAVQRVVKFIKYLKIHSVHVLTIRTEYYNMKEGDGTGISVPVSNEKIIRTGIFDFFSSIIRAKNYLTNKGETVGTSSVSQESNGFYEQTDKSLFQKLKDIFSYILRFPDPYSYWLMPAVCAGYKLIRQNKIDVIFATGQPWTALIVGYILKLLTGVKLIIDFRDPWVNNPFHYKTGFEARLDKFAEKHVVSSADVAIANTSRLRNELVARYPQKKTGIQHIPNGFEKFQVGAATNGRNENQLIISHAGFLYSRRDPAPLLNAIAAIIDKEPGIGKNIVFRQIGNVQLNYDLPSFIIEKNLQSNVKFMGQVSHQDSLAAMAQSDVLLILQQGTKNQVPSKFYEYLMFDKPIVTIGEPDSEMAEIIFSEEIGGFFQESQIGEITDYLLSLYRLKQTGKPLQLNAPGMWKYEISNVAKRLQSLIDLI